jgi:hypothetical protein
MSTYPTTKAPFDLLAGTPLTVLYDFARLFMLYAHIFSIFGSHDTIVARNILGMPRHLSMNDTRS